MMAAMFLLLAMPVCLFFAIAVPLGQSPDEGAHAVRADSLSRGQWLGRRGPITYNGAEHLVAGVDADPVVLGVQQNAPDLQPHKIDPERLQQEKAMGWDAPSFILIGPPAGYMPVFYVPAALTILATRLIGASPYEAEMAARIANTVAFLLIGGAALIVARRAQTLLFCTLAVPMTLFLAGSLNQDGLIIATSVLAASLLTRAWETADRPEAIARQSSYRFASFALALVIAAKPPYLPLAALLLLPLPPLRPWSEFRAPLLRRFAFLLITIVPAVIWTWFSVRHTSAPVPREPYHPGPLWPGDPTILFEGTDPGAQLKVLLAHPVRFLTLPLDSMGHIRHFGTELIGRLGWLAISLPPYLYTLWGVALGAAGLADTLNGKSGRLTIRWLDALVLLLASLAAIIGVWLSQYLIWTNVGDARIEGPQGRYLLPILPAVAIAFSCLAVRRHGAARAALASVPVTASAVGLVALPILILTLYYRP